MIPSTAEIDISFESSLNSERHRLGSYPIRFIFHPKTRGKRNIENFACLSYLENVLSMSKEPKSCQVHLTIRTVGDIGEVAIQYVSFFTLKHVENGTES